MTRDSTGRAEQQVTGNQAQVRGLCRRGPGGVHTADGDPVVFTLQEVTRWGSDTSYLGVVFRNRRVGTGVNGSCVLR